MRKVNPGQRIHVPNWLGDPEKAAPCICGRSLAPGEPYMMVEGELNMKRWFHMSCWAMFSNIADDDEDWDDWPDE